MTNKEKTETLLKWLSEYKAINEKIIEQEAGIPSTTIAQARRGREIPARHWPALVLVLKRYGMDKKLIKVK